VYIFYRSSLLPALLWLSLNLALALACSAMRCGQLPAKLFINQRQSIREHLFVASVTFLMTFLAQNNVLGFYCCKAML
jgi:hypothetical protein